ncbi:MAG: tRNA threonylcarbamoyladenosine biosynthesis protein TsaE [Syntrophorhabdus sp. PtaB.Bin184]|jgi:tRNA threonylcarbamoyladenosine biosynthesis protein TsaE|nr:MAG: tRNA threonylcarbamoyladenosine biosynthesis protein TsaE [Syntrophorhabdus sp. PtaB.Bin184]
MARTEYISKDPSETIDIGEKIGRLAVPGEVYAIYGDLGAGKTQLVKGIARGLGVPDWEYVVSPSFTLMNVYEGVMTLCHVDLYRLEEADLGDLNIEEFLAGGIVAVEWAERSRWWTGVTEVRIEISGEMERKIVIIKQENPGGMRLEPGGNDP